MRIKLSEIRSFKAPYIIQTNKYFKAMKIIIDCANLSNFNAWSGAINTKETILDNNKEKEFENLIDDLYPEGLTDTQLNDILWFDSEWIFEQIGINEDEQTEDEQTEDEDE